MDYKYVQIRRNARKNLFKKADFQEFLKKKQVSSKSYSIDLNVATVNGTYYFAPTNERSEDMVSMSEEERDSIWGIIDFVTAKYPFREMSQSGMASVRILISINDEVKKMFPDLSVVKYDKVLNSKNQVTKMKIKIRNGESE